MHSIRDYWRIEDTEGRRFWLYRSGDGYDSNTGDLRWYLHGMF
jgi:protein ImuB